MADYIITHREAFNKPYLKVELKNNIQLEIVQKLLKELQTIKNINITNNKRTDMTVYPDKFYEPNEVEEEITVQLDSFFNSQPIDPYFKVEELSTISNQAYSQIIDKINNFGLELEKLKSLHPRFNEEGFRDFFLPHKTRPLFCNGQAVQPKIKIKNYRIKRKHRVLQLQQ